MKNEFKTEEFQEWSMKPAIFSSNLSSLYSISLHSFTSHYSTCSWILFLVIRPIFSFTIFFRLERNSISFKHIDIDTIQWNFRRLILWILRDKTVVEPRVKARMIGICGVKFPFIKINQLINWIEMKNMYRFNFLKLIPIILLFPSPLFFSFSILKRDGNFRFIGEKFREVNVRIFFF